MSRIIIPAELLGLLEEYRNGGEFWRKGQAAESGSTYGELRF